METLVERESVKAVLEPGPAAHAILLTHGAGSHMNAPILRAISAKLRGEHGWSVMRCELPFRQKHAGPPRPAEAAGDRAGLWHALRALRDKVGPEPKLWLGGHSYGGRQATMLAADDAELDVMGLLLLSYPLHPPGKPEQLRTAHLPALRKPAFFAHGSKDEFGTREEMEAALKLIPASTQLFVVDGARHDLGGGRKLEFVDAFLGEFVAGLG